MDILPNSSTSAGPRSSLRSKITALPPSATILRTVASPKPDAPLLQLLLLHSLNTAPFTFFNNSGIRHSHTFTNC